MKKNKGTEEFQKMEAKYADDLFGKIQCMECEHEHGDGTCDAFPEQIPFDILTGRHDHRKPYPGDRGIQFKAKRGDA